MRLDQALVARGLAASRSRAQALIAAGAVRVAGTPATRPAIPVTPDAEIAVDADPCPWVSRAALKLVHALDSFGLDPGGAEALDLGASTGGFTQVLLERGAARVHAVDVGHGQIAGLLRADPRVVVREGVNVRDLLPGDVPPPGWITADLSFISLAKALPAALALARPGAWLVTLVKPQFEVGRGAVGKGGIVKDSGAQTAACDGVEAFLAASGWHPRHRTESPILGGDGNREFLIAATKHA